MSKQNVLKFLWFAASTAGCFWMAAGVDRASSMGVIGGYSLLFVLFAIAVKYRETVPLRELVVVAVILRMVFFVGTPRLSDDYHRFIWEGTLLVNGYNPTALIPDVFMASHEPSSEVLHASFEAMNSASYPTVYPPLHQAVFALGALSGTVNGAVFTMRGILFVGEIMTMLLLLQLLPRFQRQRSDVVFYALNPLVVVELTGNLHFEGLMLMWMGMALLAFFRSRTSALPSVSAHVWLFMSGFFFAAAVFTKLTPLLLIPLAVVVIRKLKPLVWISVGALVLAIPLLLVSITSEGAQQMADGLNLFFRRFEFNASVYYLVRFVGTQMVGYNAIGLIGPVLALLTVFTIVVLAIRSGRRLTLQGGAARVDRKVIDTAVWSWLVYLLLATTVHPWYAIVPATLAVLATGALRFALAVFTFSVTLSYSHYHNNAFNEHYVVIAVGYALPVLAGFLYSRFQCDTISRWV